MSFLNVLTPNGYILLGLIILVAMSLYSYLWKNFRTVAWIILAITTITVIYFGFGQDRKLSDVIIQVNGINSN